MDASYKNLGIVLSPDYNGIGNAISLIQLAESLDYSQIAFPELWGFDIVSIIGYAGAITKRISLSSGILNIFSRTPATVAQTALTLQFLTKNRFILGIGTSGSKVIENWHGLSFNHPLNRTREYIQILRTLMSRKKVDTKTQFHGHLKDFKIRIARFAPFNESNNEEYNQPELLSSTSKQELLPVLAPPIYLGAIGSRNIQLARENCDGWIPFLIPQDILFSYCRDLLAKSNKLKQSTPPDNSAVVPTNPLDNEKISFEVSPFIPTLVGEEDHKIESLKRFLSYYIGGMGDYYYNMLKSSDFGEEIETIKLKWKSDNRNISSFFSDELLHQLCITGSVKECKDKIKLYLRNGVTRPMLMFPNGSRIEDIKDTLIELRPNS